MTIDNFLTKVRSTIGDTKKTKYTDDRLLDLVNEGMTDIVKISNIFRASTDILIENNVPSYKLPDDVYFLTRVTQNNDPIPFMSYEEMDKRKHRWEEEVGTDVIKNIVYDLQNINEITVYPLLNGITGTYFKLPDGTSVAMRTGDDGAITYIEDNTQEHEVVIDREDPDYGTLVGIAYDWTPLRIQYIKKPIVYTAISDTLELDDIYIPTLKYYVAGTVLFDDDRLENVQKGQALLVKYNSLVNEMKNKSTRNFHRVNRSSAYRTAFN